MQETLYIFQVLICKGMFGNPQQQCRFSLRPFRARSVKVSGIDFSNQDRWRLEFGGTDYMEGIDSFFSTNRERVGVKKRQVFVLCNAQCVNVLMR